MLLHQEYNPKWQKIYHGSGVRLLSRHYNNYCNTYLLPHILSNSLWLELQNWHLCTCTLGILERDAIQPLVVFHTQKRLHVLLLKARLERYCIYHLGNQGNHHTKFLKFPPLDTVDRSFWIFSYYMGSVFRTQSIVGQLRLYRWYPQHIYQYSILWDLPVRTFNYVHCKLYVHVKTYW